MKKLFFLSMSRMDLLEQENKNENWRNFLPDLHNNKDELLNQRHLYSIHLQVKFVFSKKATKIEKIFTVDLTVLCLIDSEDFVKFCGLLRKNEL